MAKKKPSLPDLFRLGTMAKEVADYARRIGVPSVSEAAKMVDEEVRKVLSDEIRNGADLFHVSGPPAIPPRPAFRPAAPPAPPAAAPAGSPAPTAGLRVGKIEVPLLGGGAPLTPPPDGAAQGTEISPGVRMVDDGTSPPPPPATPPVVVPGVPPGGSGESAVVRKNVPGFGEEMGKEGAEIPPL